MSFMFTPHVRCSDLYSLVLAVSLFKGNEESLFLIFSSVIKKDFSVTSAFKRLRL